MEFKEKFRFVESRLDTLMAFQEISGEAYIALSIELLRVGDDWGLKQVMNMIETAVWDEQNRKDKEKREREEKREERRRAK